MQRHNARRCSGQGLLADPTDARRTQDGGDDGQTRSVRTASGGQLGGDVPLQKWRHQRQNERQFETEKVNSFNVLSGELSQRLAVSLARGLPG